MLHHHFMIALLAMWPRESSGRAVSQWALPCIASLCCSSYCVCGGALLRPAELQLTVSHCFCYTAALQAIQSSLCLRQAHCFVLPLWASSYPLTGSNQLVHWTGGKDCDCFKAILTGRDCLLHPFSEPRHSTMCVLHPSATETETLSEFVHGVRSVADACLLISSSVQAAAPMLHCTYSASRHQWHPACGSYMCMCAL